MSGGSIFTKDGNIVAVFSSSFEPSSEEVGDEGKWLSTGALLPCLLTFDVKIPGSDAEASIQTLARDGLVPTDGSHDDVGVERLAEGGCRLTHPSDR